jgi:CRP/FNR family transcriptional regulator, cyclic AMP receptor protein
MQDFGTADRDRLMARFGKRFQRGEVIYREGESASQAFLLQEGRVRLVRRVRGIERNLAVLRPVELFGESALIPGAKRTSTAVALTEGATLALDQNTFRRLLETNPPVAIRVVEQLVRRLRDAEDQIEIMMLRDTQSKVVNALIKMAQASPDASTGAVAIGLSPMDLSTRVGLDVDTVKRAVQQLRDQNYIRVIDERLEVPDVDALFRLYALLALKEEIRGAEGSSPPPAEAPASTGKPSQ